MENLTTAISYLEFGTYEGDSMKWWLSMNDHPESRFIGFDSFQGLPEAWQFYETGFFSTGSEAPRIEDPRCRFVKGLFQQTLPAFLKDYCPSRRQVLFLDADLYSSTVFVLHQVGPYLRPQDVLLFDEFHVWMHEFRAFVSFLSAFPLQYRVLRRSPDWSQVAMKVLSNPNGIGADGSDRGGKKG